jgi:HK97 family phage portal protein
VVDARQVHAIRWPHPIHLADGLSPISAGSVTVDTSEQLERSRWYSFLNAIRPGMKFELDPNVDPDPEDKEAFRQDMRARAAGTPNTGKDLILPPGVKGERMDTTPDEMSYVESFPQVRDAILALHGTPGVAVGVTDAGSYAAYYASLLQFISLTVQPLLDLIADELNEWLVPYFGGVGEIIEIALKARSIEDPQLLEQRLKTDIAARAITINELRVLRGLPPVPWGEERVGGAPTKAGDEKNDEDEPGQRDSDTTGVLDPVRRSQPKNYQRNGVAR